jgi:flagellar motor protein MotB
MKLQLDSFYQANLSRDGKIFVIIGHTDSQKAENVALSEARAESVKSYLNEKYDFNEIKYAHVLDSAAQTHWLIMLLLQVVFKTEEQLSELSDLTISQVFYRKGP